MFCTEKERKTCNVEKMTCEGCYYNNENNYLESKEAYELYFRGNPTLEKEVRNLIKRNKELEEIKNSKLDKYLHNNLWICKDLAENYIHKSKVKEILKENQFLIDSSQGAMLDKDLYGCYGKVELCEELLEE